MTALTNTEILAALPAESRKKIDTAFEALSQSMPSDKERIILYRVAHTLKLNPTDTHFSVMAALHYYLQLYQTIPDKIIKAGNEEIGKHIQNLKGTAEREMAIARDKVIDELAQKVGGMAQQLAGDAAAAEKAHAISFAAKWVSVGVFSCAVVFGGVGYGLRLITDEVNLNTARKAVAAADERTAAAEKQALDDIEAVKKSIGWVGTVQGQIAKKFFDSGSGQVAASCDSPVWDVVINSDGKFCVPKRRDLFTGDNSKYGWKIP